MPNRCVDLDNVLLRWLASRAASSTDLRRRALIVAASGWGMIGGTLTGTSVAHGQECVVQAQARALGQTGNSQGTSEVRLDTGELTIAPAAVDTGMVGPGAVGGHAGAQVQYAASAAFGTLELAMNCYADTGNPYEAGALSMASSDPGAAPNARFVDRLTVSHATEPTIQVKIVEQLLGSVSLSGIPMASDDPTGVARLYCWTNTGHGQLRDLPIVDGYTTDSAEVFLTIANGSYLDIEQSLQFFATCNTGPLIQPFRAEGLASQTAVTWVEVLTPGGVVTSCSGTNYVVDSSETDGATSSGTGGTDAGVTSASTTSEAQTTIGETSSDVADASVSETSGPGVTDVATSQVASSAPSSSDTLVAETTGPVVSEATTSEPDSSIGIVDTGAISSATHDTANTSDYIATSATTSSEGLLDAGVVTSGVVSSSGSSVNVAPSSSSEAEATTIVPTSSVGETSSSTGPNLDITLQTVGNSDDPDNQSDETSAASGSSVIVDAGLGDAGPGTGNPQPSCECRTVQNPRSSAYRAVLPALAGLMLLRRRRQVRGAA